MLRLSSALTGGEHHAVVGKAPKPGALENCLLRAVHGRPGGAWLGINVGERLTRLVICSTGAKRGTDETWDQRIEAVAKAGEEAMRTVAKATVERWITPAFAQQRPRAINRFYKMVAGTPPKG